MANKIYSCNEAISYLRTVYGKSDIVYITLSKNASTEAGYQELASLLDTTSITEGYYLIEPDTDAPLGQKVHVEFVTPIVLNEGDDGDGDGSSIDLSNLEPDIILTVQMQAGETLSISDFWTMNDNSNGGKVRGVVFEENGTLEDSLSHTYQNSYEGKVFIYNYSICKAPGGTAQEVGCKYRITDIEFVKPQVVEDGRFLFGSMTGLKTVKGTMILSETYSTGGLQQLFYNATALTSLKGFVIMASSTKPTNLGVLFMNSSLNDTMLNEIRFVGLKKDEMTSYSQAFSNTKITHVNNKLVGKNATNFYCAFEGCPVTYIPSGVLDKCSKGTRAFCVAKISGVSPNVSLASLEYGNEMFSGCPMTYTLSKQLYDTLTEVTGAEMPTNRNDNKKYTITFACVSGEEAKIAKTFGIPAINPNTSANWAGNGGIPRAEYGQFWLSPKGWWVTFAGS